MNELQAALGQGCFEGQGFGGHANPSYPPSGHPGIDIECGWASPIHALASGYVYSTFPVEAPASDGYTAVFTICETPLEVFEFSYGHVSEIDVAVGQQVEKGVTIIGKEGNYGPVYSGNRLITLAEQRAGNHAGHHRHLQKRALLKVKQTRQGRHYLQTANGLYYVIENGTPSYFEVYDYYNGFNGCVDWTTPLFDRDLALLSVGYDVYLLQKAMVLHNYGSYTPSGYFGVLTLASVRAYQKQNGLPATGYCGPLTRAKLNAQFSQLS